MCDLVAWRFWILCDRVLLWFLVLSLDVSLDMFIIVSWVLDLSGNGLGTGH